MSQNYEPTLAMVGAVEIILLFNEKHDSNDRRNLTHVLSFKKMKSSFTISWSLNSYWERKVIFHVANKEGPLKVQNIEVIHLYINIHWGPLSQLSAFEGTDTEPTKTLKSFATVTLVLVGLVRRINFSPSTPNVLHTMKSGVTPAEKI